MLAISGIKKSKAVNKDCDQNLSAEMKLTGRFVVEKNDLVPYQHSIS